MSAHESVGGRVLTRPFLFLLLFAVIGLVLLGKRFALGLGAVTNMNNGYPWGLWVTWDVVIVTAFACGGYALALVVYLLNKGEYHPLVRPALLASLFGYTLGAASAFIDMGRWWQAYNIFLPWNMNFSSVMLEVGLCVTAYVLVLAVEFAPAVFERFDMKVARERLNRWLFIIIGLGILLPTMHQSSLGSMLIVVGHKIHPLWQSGAALPLLFLLSAIAMGFAIVAFEAALGALGFRRPLEARLLKGLTRFTVALLATFLAVRFGELLLNGKLGLAFGGGLMGTMFLIESALFVVPLLILGSEANRGNGRLLFVAAVSLLLAGAIYRLNAYLIGFSAGPGYQYFPSVEEILITVGLMAIEILAYLYVVKKFPVMHRLKAA